MRVLEAVGLFFMILGYGSRRLLRMAWRGAVAAYHEGSEEVARRLRVHGTLALLLVVLLPTGAWATEPWPTLRQFLQFSQRQQEDYVRAYMWGAGFALNKAGMALDDCQGADKSADEVAAALRALAITGSLAEQKRSANRFIGDLLFDGCRFLRERL